VPKIVETLHSTFSFSSLLEAIAGSDDAAKSIAITPTAINA